MTRLLIQTLLATAFLSGCAGVQTLSYKEPLDGPRARVRFATQNSGVTVLFSYADSQCQTNEQEMMRLRAGDVFQSQPKRLDMPLWKFHDNGAQEVYLVPGHFVGRFEGGEDWGMTGYSCIVPFSFNVVAGKDYEVEFAPSPKGCAVLINEIVPDDKGGFRRSPSEGLPVSENECSKKRFRML